MLDLRSFGARDLTMPLTVVLCWYMVRQCRKPTGPLGKAIARVMNRSHADLTSWGLEHVQVNKGNTVLDIGCGGGRTVQKLSNLADPGKVYGVDYAGASVAASVEFNRAAIASGRVAIQRATVSNLPFADESFDVVTAFETHYYWPDYDGDMREILRILKPGGSLLMVAEIHSGHRLGWSYRLVMKPLGGAVLTPDGHRDLFTRAGFESVEVFLSPQGWICLVGRKPR